MAISEEDCIEALELAAKRLGKSPTKPEYEELGLTPASATIIKKVGGWNKAKERAGLDTNASRGSRIQEKPEGVHLPEGMIWENLSVDQRWHYRNAELKCERTRNRRARLRKWIYSIKLESKGCSHCNEDDPACLDFHHRENDNRLMPVNKMVPHGFGKDRIRMEIAKCDLICANCHRKLHAQPFSTNTRKYRVKLRRWVQSVKADSNGCVNCAEADPDCLDFHHLNEREKIDSVSQLISYEPSKEELLIEMNKCQIICANCHRKEHFVWPEEPC